MPEARPSPSTTGGPGPVAGRRRPPALLGIAGAPGAGKSTLAERSSRRSADRRAGADGRLPPRPGASWSGWAGPTARARRTPSTQRVRRRCCAGCAGGADDVGLRAGVPPGSGGAGGRGDGGAAPVRLVVTEGNYLLLASPPGRRCGTLLHEVWFLDLDAELRLRRLVARHVAYGGRRRRRGLGATAATRRTPRWWRAPPTGPTW